MELYAKLPYGVCIYKAGGSWFVEQRTLLEIKEIGIFDKEYKAKRAARNYVLSGKGA